MELNSNDLKVEISTIQEGWSHKKAVTVTHIPSGLSATVSSEKTQQKNKALAVEELQKRLSLEASEVKQYDRYDWVIRAVEPKMEYKSKTWNWYHDECKFWIDANERVQAERAKVTLSQDKKEVK